MSGLAGLAEITGRVAKFERAKAAQIELCLS